MVRGQTCEELADGTRQENMPGRRARRTCQVGCQLLCRPFVQSLSAYRQVAVVQISLGQDPEISDSKSKEGMSKESQENALSFTSVSALESILLVSGCRCVKASAEGGQFLKRMHKV